MGPESTLPLVPRTLALTPAQHMGQFHRLEDFVCAYAMVQGLASTSSIANGFASHRVAATNLEPPAGQRQARASRIYKARAQQSSCRKGDRRIALRKAPLNGGRKRIPRPANASHEEYIRPITSCPTRTLVAQRTASDRGAGRGMPVDHWAPMDGAPTSGHQVEHFA